MKANELRTHTTCDLCRNKIMHSGLPLFWKVSVERFGIDFNAIKRADGLTAMLGNAILADAMGPNEDVAQCLMEAVALTLCEPCAMNNGLMLAAMSKAEETV